MNFLGPSEITLNNIRHRITRSFGFEEGCVSVCMKMRSPQVEVIPPANFSHEQMTVCNSTIHGILNDFGFGDGVVVFKHPQTA